MTERRRRRRRSADRSRQKAGLNRAIAAASIGRFRIRLRAKILDRAEGVVDVDERYTSQTCTACGAGNPADARPATARDGVR